MLIDARKSWVLLALTSVVSALAACAPCPGPDAPSGPAPSEVATWPEEGSGALASLNWLTGWWHTRSPGGATDEVWLAPQGDHMFGVNRTAADGATVHHERLTIEARPEGIFYVAEPSEQARTEFRLVEQRPGYARFDNPEHDFPTTVEYRLEGAELLVRVFNAERESSWRWRRRGSR